MAVTLGLVEILTDIARVTRETAAALRNSMRG
jgi:hypothetical protein